MLPVEFYDKLICHPGMVMVVRDDVKSHSGRIELPASYLRGVKSMTAEVVKIGKNVYDQSYKIGDRVLLAQGVGKTIVFGEDEITVYVCRPEEIAAVVVGDSDVEYADLGAQQFARYFPQAFEAIQDGKADESG